MKAKNFQELQVWQKAHHAVLRIYKVTESFPNTEKFGLTSQIRRSSASICANIAEGYKKSTKEFVRFSDIAQGSVEETKYHLILSKDLKYLEDQEFRLLFDSFEEVGKMLNAITMKLRFKATS